MKNAYLEILRGTPVGHGIPGELWLNGAFFCYTMERVGVAVPVGIYQVLLNMSPKFRKLMPLLLGGLVTASWGVRMHCGTRPEDSDACVLVGLARLPDHSKIYRSQEAFEALMGRLVQYSNITLTIR